MIPPHVSHADLYTQLVRERTHVTGRKPGPNLVRVRTVEWPEHEAFIAHLDRLKRLRGYRYDIALAEAAEISHSAISNWRSRKQRPSLAAITSLAKALDTDPHDLAARAGVAEGFTQAATPAQLPPELEHLIDQYTTASPDRRTELLARIAWISEWFDATDGGDGDERPRRRAG